ncbi:MAG: hypothetical protein L6Q97_04370 [Thermoanaerobaculia bacterium]|nr:hypothetical protein [Thermoanaerobaculia bacterium]
MSNPARRIGYWLLLCMFTASATPVGELLKLPVLIEHLREHRQETPDMTLIGFFVLHYFSGDVRDADYERDMQLPFKTVELSGLTLATAPAEPAPVAPSLTPAPACRKCLPPLALLCPPVPYVAMPSEPPEA